MVPLIALLVLASATVASADTLNPPFAVRTPDGQTAAKACVPSPAPLVRFAPASKYGQAGAQRDQVDPDAERAFEEAMKPLRAFSREVVKAANDYHRTGRASAAACAATHLEAWAKADAIGAPETHTAWFKLATTMSGLSLAYMQIKPALPASGDQAKTIERWLNRRGHEVAYYFETLKTPRSSRNNHRAWAGLAAAATAAASGDKALLTKGVESFRIAACQATSEGALPLEVERGKKALEYHLYALAALTTLAEIGARNGVALHKECGSALDRVATFTLSAIADPTRIAALAGVSQEDASSYLTPAKLVFIEPWLARRGIGGTAEPLAALLKRRPFALTDLGGDQTLLHAVRGQ